MFRQVIAVLVCFLLYPNSVRAQTSGDANKAPATDQVRSQLTNLQPGTLLELKLSDGSNVTGYLEEAQADRVRIRTEKAKTGIRREIPLSEIREVRRKSHTPVAAWVVVGVLAGVAIAVIIGVAKYLHNE